MDIQTVLFCSMVKPANPKQTRFIINGVLTIRIKLVVLRQPIVELRLWTIEQRIGRCHRYGQKYDVVVVNFLNMRNYADVRVFNLLSTKFKLFDDVFGASDEVLGQADTIDIESRIWEIYQQCRSEEEINQAFEKLQQDMQEQIDERMTEVRSQVFLRTLTSMCTGASTYDSRQYWHFP